MPRLRLGPKNESLQNEADKYSLQSQHNKNPKHSEFFDIICFETSLPYRYLTYQPRFDATWKALCIAYTCDRIFQISNFTINV